MSNEEKEALEIVELYFGEEPTLNITKYVNIVLNLIEKQQKEIEELKNEVMEKELIIDGMKEDRRIAVEEIQEEYFISKDKIKAKIEEYKKQQKEEPDAYLCIKVLSSLLEKE